MSRHSSSLPLIGVPTNQRMVNDALNSTAAIRFLKPVYEISGALPVMIPALSHDYDVRSVLDRIDGLMLTGGVSYVAPHRYGSSEMIADDHLDLARDAVTITLVQEALQRGIPIFGICRGLQEINVACGGSLVTNASSKGIDHGNGGDGDLAARLLAEAHGMAVEAGGLFERWFGKAHAFNVNSLHCHGLGAIGAGLRVEARASDGTVEAVSHSGAGFAVGVMWHPEWHAADNPVSNRLYQEFGNAIRDYAAQP